MSTVPALSALLSLGREHKDPSVCPEQTLLRFAGIDGFKATCLPAAELKWQGEFGSDVPQCCVVADPVHMLADTDHARLMGTGTLQLQDEESQALLKSLNHTFEEDGLQFFQGRSGSWFITGRDASMLGTWPTHVLVGRNVASFLPEGEASADWRKLMTEIQMLLFSHPVNQVRTAEGQLTINALWLWGGGKLPQQTNRQALSVFSDSSFAAGLSTASGFEQHALSQFDPANLPDSNILLFDDSMQERLLYEDYAGWQQRLLQLESGVFQPLLKQFQSGRVSRIVLNIGNRREFLIQPSLFRRLFSRSRSLADFVDPAFVEPVED